MKIMQYFSNKVSLMRLSQFYFFKNKMLEVIQSLLALIFSLSLCGCGGTSEPLEDIAIEPPVSTSIGISGGGVKGPLLNAQVSIYELDLTKNDLLGSLLSSGATDSSGAIINVDIDESQSGLLVLEFVSNENTIDLTSSASPIYDRLVSIVDSSYVLNGGKFYATPLTTMAFELAKAKADDGNPYIGNQDNSISESEWLHALGIAQKQVKSTLGFGIGNDIDIFLTAPLVNNETVSDSQLAATALYRQANEALAAFTQQVVDNSSANNNAQEIFDGLIKDLSDGEIDGKDQNGDVSALAALDQPIQTTLISLNLDELKIPGTDILVSNIEEVLVAEKVTTGESVDTTALEDGTVSVDTEPAEPVSDVDGDGVKDSDDVFPEDPLEWLDTDEDGVGDNSDAFPEDPTETVDSDGDGYGDNSDVFPNDETEWADSDGDGIGDNSDPFPDVAYSGFDVNFWVGAEDTKLSFDGVTTDASYFSFSNADCDIENILNCTDGVEVSLTGEDVFVESTSSNKAGYHRFIKDNVQREAEIGLDRWAPRSSFAAVVFKEKLWMIGGEDSVYDEVERGFFDGYVANDVWSTQDGSYWVERVKYAAFTARSRHGAVVFNDKIWVIGGADYENSFLNDVWSSTDGVNWTQETANASFPARRNPGLIIYDNKLWLIGGQGEGFLSLNDVWYTEDGITWTEATNNAAFPAHDYYGLVVHNNQMMIVGGSGLYRGVWSSTDGVNWTDLGEADYPARNVFSVETYNGKVWLTSGYQSGYTRSIFVSDNGINFTELQEPQGTYRQKRAFPGFKSFDGKLFYFGGYGNSKYNDVWSTEDGENWVQHTTGAGAPIQRGKHSLVEFNQQLIILGGYTDNLQSSIWSSNDSIEWNQLSEIAPFGYRSGQTAYVFNDQLWVNGGLDTPTAVNDIWSTTDGVNWTQKVSQAEFSERLDHKVVEWNGKLWLTAGWDQKVQGDLNDVWSSSDGITWSLETESAEFATRYGHSSFVFNNKLWVAGGRGYQGSNFATDYDDIWSSSDGISWTQEAATTAIGSLENVKMVVFKDKIWAVAMLIDSVVGGIDETSIWSSTDGVNWTLENDNPGFKARIDFSLTATDNQLVLNGGNIHNSVTYLQGDTWVSDDGINWRLGIKKTIDFSVP